MKRSPMRRIKPLRRTKAGGPDLEREPKPWASALSSSTIKTGRQASYSGATSGRPVEKDEPARSEAWRRLVAGMPCMICNGSPCQAAHPNCGKGMGIKADDRECFALCPRCHTRFDQGALFTKEARRELEPAWGRQTRYFLMASGAVSPRLATMLKLQPDGSYEA